LIQGHLLSLIIFAPLAGAVINWLVGRRLRNERFIGIVACASVGISTLIAFYLAFKPDGALRATQPLMDHLWTWIQVGSFRADFGLAMDRLSGIYALFVTFVGLLIHIFATGYMHGDRGYYRFFAYLNLFMFAMLTLVLADNFLLMFVGWEGVGLCSYLLIGFYLDKEEAAPAAKKAFIANRVGDWGFVLGLMLIFFKTGSISFFDKPAQGVISALNAIGSLPVDGFTWHAIFAGGVTSIAVLLFIGATGKSAQIPLFVWLPDAMAGPTPVSALIHAATMVTAGVYMVVRCSAIYTHAPTAMFIVAIVGAATALFAATIGIAQNDIKKVLAYSTISQLGYMFLACGMGAFVAAIFHVMTHAFFKAQLFLGSGSVIHGMHHEQDMRRMGGLRKYMPITWLTMCAGWLAICGVPIFAGFFSKDEILWKTWSGHIADAPPALGKALWFIGAVTALLTAIYMTRLMVMTFWGNERFREKSLAHEHGDGHANVAHEPRESPWTMTIPLIVLAILSTVGGLVGVELIPVGRRESDIDWLPYAHHQRVSPGRQLGRGLRDRVFLAFWFLMVATASIFMQCLVTLPLAMKNDGLSPVAFGRALAVNGLLIVLVQPWASSLLSRLRRSAVLAGGTSLIGLGFGLTAFAHSALSYTLTVVIWSLGEIAVLPVSAAVVADLAVPALRGTYQGAYNIAWAISWILGPIVGTQALACLGGRFWAACFAVSVVIAAGHLAIAGARKERLAGVEGRGEVDA